MKPYVPYIHPLKYRINETRRKKVYKKTGLEAGIDAIKIVEFKNQNAYIDPKIAKKQLGVQEDDVKQAIKDSTKQIMDYAKLHKQL